jgi:hypothetical protein
VAPILSNNYLLTKTTMRMKKILSLLSLMMLGIMGANAETVKYALNVGDTFTSGQTVEVKSGEVVVATITYGEEGGDDFKAAKAYTGIEGYTAFTEGNGTNGNKTGGTFYTITPNVDATISVAVCLNADKAFYIEEDGTALAAYDGVKVTEKYYGTYEFEATANKAYKVYCAGSKLGFFGFEMTFTVGGGEEPPVATDKTIGLVPGPWAVDGATFAAYAWDSKGTNAWYPFVEVSGAYATQIPDSLTNIILVRLKPATADGFSTENYGLNWSNKWNQTDDIDFTAIANQTIFTITGWGEYGGNSTYTAATPLDIAKAAFQAAIDKVKAFNTPGLAEIIADAEAALADENATIESIQAAAATFEASVKAYVQFVLSTAIPMIESLNAESLADAISTAKAVLENEDATLEELANALFGMIEPARPYIVQILQQTVDVCKSLGIDTSAAEAALSQGDAATTVGLALTLYSLTQEAIPTIQGVVNTLKEYMTTFSSDAALALKDYFDKLESDIANGDIAAVKDDIVLLMYNGSSYLQADIVKLEGYAAILGNEAITADVAAMKAAIQAGSFVNLLAAVEKFKVDFLAAAPDFVAQVKFAKAGYVDAGKTNALQQLEQAIANAEQALAAEDATIVTVGLAIRNLIVAIQTYRDANSTYTIAGTKDLTGTEEDWQIVETNNMTKSAADYTYEWTAENVTVNADNQPQFKVVIVDIDGNEAWIPTGGGETNWVITPDVVGGEGVFNITITYNAKTQEIGVTAEDVTTGINAVAAENTNAVIYNMSGQRVMNVQRGLYIINGKKVVLK